MNALITGVDYFDDVLRVKGEVDHLIEDHNVSLCLRRREVEQGLEYPEEYRFTTVMNGTTFSIEESINDIFVHKKIHDGVIWDFFIHHDGEYLETKMTTSAPGLKEVDYRPFSHNLFKVKPYVNGRNGLSMLVLQNDLFTEVADVTFKDGRCSIEVDINGTMTDNDLKDKIVTLKAKKREQEHLFEYYESKTIGPASAGRLLFHFSLDDLYDGYPFNKNVIWDLFIELKHTDGLVLDLPVNKKENIHFNYYQFEKNDLYRVKPYKTGHDTLAFIIKYADISPSIEQIYFEENRLLVTGHIEATNYNLDKLDEFNSSFVLKKRQTVGQELTYNLEKGMELLITNQNFDLVADVSELLEEEVIHNKDVWDLFLRVATISGNAIDLPINAKKINQLKIGYEEMFSNPRVKFKPFVNGKQNLSLYFLDNVSSENQLKVAVLGSCFSRNAFNSNAYFNPEYKTYYNCAYTQFHSSLISLVSNPVPIDLNQLDDMNESNKKFLEADFEKDFFEKITQLNPDYVIIDLYADAAREVIKISEEQYISASLAFRQSKYFKNFLDYEVVTHENNDVYFSIWEKSMKLFAKKLREVIPEERVILNLGGFTSTYVDKDGSIKKFSNQNRIKAYNYFWDRLNNYFIECMPRCKVISMKDMKFIGDSDHPFGRSYSHYQSGYYKEFLRRLNDMALVDYNNERNKTLNRRERVL
ncbi:DUF6270 domain-containing protein [Bacillus sp. N1-1]|uniref:DUF6270 domain-containing protein n=1 Tax=Bacillus sp. N1-1 TaxID=2682541 RepID=UPI0013178451|nr:DUF6270 domain-containing protein [Bacillus sp. N1-1]QHA93638.1 hypothetical protein GNK04_20625 [Bacillus sp. N1-1]